MLIAVAAGVPRHCWKILSARHDCCNRNQQIMRKTLIPAVQPFASCSLFASCTSCHQRVWLTDISMELFLANQKPLHEIAGWTDVIASCAGHESLSEGVPDGPHLVGS